MQFPSFHAAMHEANLSGVTPGDSASFDDPEDIFPSLKV